MYQTNTIFLKELLKEMWFAIMEAISSKIEGISFNYWKRVSKGINSRP